MFDPTRVSVAIFTLIKLVLWLGVIVAFGMLAAKYITDWNDGKLPSVFFQQRRWQVIGWVGLLFFAVFYTANETAYRPKQIVQPPNPALERQLREIDALPRPASVPRPTPTPSWQEQQERNRQENEASRKEFEKLPVSR